MNEYLIEHKIDTLADLLDQRFDYDGFQFRQWDFNITNGSLGDAWIARKIVTAESVQDAINMYRASLFPIVDRIVFISQCSGLAEFGSFFILRQNNNEARIFFFRFIESASGVPLQFNATEQAALRSLEAIENREMFLDSFERPLMRRHITLVSLC